MAQRTCSVDGCERPVRTRGMCNMHHQRWLKHGDPAVILRDRDPDLGQRLDRRTVRMDGDDGCWEWMGFRNYKNYGLLGWQGRQQFTHRLSYELHVGPIPEGMFVCHRCDNPPCLRPSHLFVGSVQDNADDMVAKGRSPVQIGINNPSARLTDDAVRNIRREYAEGQRVDDLAARYGVKRPTVYAILSRRLWKHIE